MPTERPDISCPHYSPLPGSKTCGSYVAGGGCARADTFMCVEWERKSARKRHLTVESSSQRGQSTASARQDAGGTPTVSPISDGASHAQHDLFGKVVAAQPVKTGARTKAFAEPLPSSVPAAATAFARPITDDEIKALEARGIELCVRSAAVDELWLVPAYTDAERNEMTFRDAATIAAVCAVFPGAEVTRFQGRNEKGGGK